MASALDHLNLLSKRRITTLPITNSWHAPFVPFQGVLTIHADEVLFRGHAAFIQLLLWRMRTSGRGGWLCGAPRSHRHEQGKKLKMELTHVVLPGHQCGALDFWPWRFTSCLIYAETGVGGDARFDRMASMNLVLNSTVGNALSGRTSIDRGRMRT